jgi:hypothetical protein|tara:strand:- start:1811 stop:2197 length:387 start_codon:yes stop_codon:yes gene_type:complete
MAEQTFENNEEGWTYSGRNSKGEPKFRRPTNQTIEFVKAYLDTKELAYFVHENQALLFIYKDKEPKSRYSPRYAYYYTTGKWGSDKRKTHYHSKGVEHFVETYYRSREQDQIYWDKLNDKPTSLCAAT